MSERVSERAVNVTMLITAIESACIAHVKNLKQHSVRSIEKSTAFRFGQWTVNKSAIFTGMLPNGNVLLMLKL